jgi:protein O-GlcNAc transferase
VKGRELIATTQKEQTLLLDMNEGKEALAKGDVDQAIAKFRRVAKERPDAAGAHYHLGLALAQKGGSEEAAAAFRKALELDPGHADARQNLERLTSSQVTADDPRQIEVFESYIRQDKFKEVEPLLEGYLKERPNSWWVWYALGYAQFAQQKVGDSIRSLSRSLALNVSNAEAHKVLGRDLMAIGRFDEAQLEFEQGAKYDPQSAEMQYNLGRLFSIQDQWPAARRAFEQALRLDPSYVEAYDGLGFALEAVGEDAAAVANYEKAAQLNEARKGIFAAPYVNLSAYYNRTGNTNAALDFARKAVQVNPKSDRGWFQMAKAHERQGELDAAVDTLNRAISINAGASSYYYVLATVYRRLGRLKESRETMETFSRLERKSNTLEEKRREGLRHEGTARE